MQAEAQYAAKMPPVLLLHGTDDTCALVKNVMQFEEALRKAGVKASGRLKVSEVSWVSMFPAVVAAVLFRGSFCVALHQADVKVSLGLVASQSLSICPWSPTATLQRFPVRQFAVALWPWRKAGITIKDLLNIGRACNALDCT